jgi:predicted nuclease with TOPRIM domain
MFALKKLVFRVTAVFALAAVMLAGINYTKSLREKLASSEQNVQMLVNHIQQQAELIEKQQQDFEKIKSANSRISREYQRHREEYRDLVARFNRDNNGNPRNFGEFVANNHQQAESLINRSTADSIRCLELASGAAHTNEELNVKLPSEINRECPKIAHPNFISSNS